VLRPIAGDQQLDGELLVGLRDRSDQVVCALSRNQAARKPHHHIVAMMGGRLCYWDIGVGVDAIVDTLDPACMRMSTQFSKHEVGHGDLSVVGPRSAEPINPPEKPSKL